MAAVFAAAEQPATNTPLKATTAAGAAAARDTARGCSTAARLGTLAHAANVVVNQTLLPMVFGQLGTQETLPLP